MLRVVSMLGEQIQNPRLILKRLLIVVATLIAISIEKRGEYLLEVERQLGPYAITDLLE